MTSIAWCTDGVEHVPEWRDLSRALLICYGSKRQQYADWRIVCTTCGKFLGHRSKTGQVYARRFVGREKFLAGALPE